MENEERKKEEDYHTQKVEEKNLYKASKLSFQGSLFSRFSKGEVIIYATVV